MKTREELLEMICGDKIFFPNGSFRTVCLSDILNILNAPTQAQLDCPYCHEPFKALYSESDITYGIIDHKVYGVYADGEKLTGLKFTFCPICGYRLKGRANGG